MLETRAIVVQVEGPRALVETDRENGCGQCNGKGCGSARLSGLFCGKSRQFKVDNPINAGIDDKVIISVAEGAIMHGAAAVYLLPVLLFLTGALIGNLWAVQAGQRDVYAAVGAAAGLAAGFVLGKWISFRRAKGHFHPYISRLWRDNEAVR